VSPRASLPGAEELFRRTSTGKTAAETAPTPADDKSTKLQVAKPEDAAGAAPPERKGPKHDEKVTFYCTREDLMALERARLALRAEHGLGADRGRIVRSALAYVLEDFDARGEDSVLVRRLSG
jgi:hypothetical protein